MNILPFEARVRVLSALVEGNSIRSTERMLGINRNTIMRLGVEAGEACAAFHDRLIRDVYCSTVQVDEIWCYVKKKDANLKAGDSPEMGDQYTFVGMCADSKLIISYLVGKRERKSARQVVADLRSRILGNPQITSDGFKPYLPAFEDSFGADCHYAMVVKHFQGETLRRPEARHRYSPGRIRGIEKRKIIGQPDPRRISTSYVERQNLTMRMQMRRFTRLTNGFSKKLRNLRAAVGLHFAHYNLCRVHETLRVTPAIQAGLTDRVWSLAELVEETLYKGLKAA